jgi:hypothetical protein
MHGNVAVFPFGQPVQKVCQVSKTPKKVFVLGVYASAVHARWVDEKGKKIITALAVASEPEIFWRGTNAEEIINQIRVPEGVGKLRPASDNLNGPSGKTLDESFFEPLGFKDRSDTWLCDLVPYSCRNPAQDKALQEKYLPLQKQFQLPDYNGWTTVPKVLVDDKRINQIMEELTMADPDVIITLGDQPLKWFTSKKFGTKSRLVDYGEERNTYGRLHDISSDGWNLKLLPLVHPRQAGRLGSNSSKWAQLHDYWVESVAPQIGLELTALT